MGIERKVRVFLPENKIDYFKNGQIQGITHYYLVTEANVAQTEYRRWGSNYFKSDLDEHNGICDSNVPIKREDLPQNVREIFEAKDREGVAKLRNEGKLEGYVDGD